MNWEEIRLEEIADFRNGVNFTNDSFGNGIKVINVADFKDRMYPDYESLGELDSEAKWHKDCFLKENDIVFVRSNGNKNLIGRSLYIKNLPTNIKVTYSAFSIRLRFKSTEDICPDFYLYLFKSPIFRSILSQYGNGANISNLNQDILNNMSIPKPPLPIQQKIASILYAYDELIENNKQRIKLLEEMAEEIYREWFVRLRFPGYENTKIVDGLPEGWEKMKLDNVLEPVKRKPKISTDKYFSEGKYPIIDQGDDFIAGYTNDESLVQFEPLPLVVFGDHTRRVKFVNYPFVSGADGTQLLSPKNKSLLPIYFYISVKNIDLSNFHYARHFKFLKQEYITIPDKIILSKFNNLVSPFFEEIQILKDKNQLLQETRDLLLPRLISGKLSVEHLLEEELGMVAEPRASYQDKI